jgi:hypothetical protein
MIYDKPLLKLKKPEINITPQQIRKGWNNKHSFLPLAQIQKLSSKIDNILGSSEDQISLQTSVMGIDAETALVIEVKNTLGDFYKFVRNNPNLDFLADITCDNDTDTDTEIESADRGKFCYLIMTNGESRRQLLSKWNQWKKYFESGNADENRNPLDFGDGTLNNLFREITEIRLWDDRDRLEEAGGISYLKKLSRQEPDTVIRIQVEFFYRRSPDKRRTAVQEFERLLTNGRIVEGSECCIDPICYHGLIAEIPAKDITTIIQYYDDLAADAKTPRPSGFQYLGSAGVRVFSSVGQMATEKWKREVTHNTPAEVARIDFSKVKQPTEDKPIIALFDGYPVTEHVTLEGRLVIDDPDSFDELTPVSERFHGTSMASLIVMGDLMYGPPQPLSRKIYLRPIMQYSKDYQGEVVSENNLLFIDYLYRAIRRLFEGEGDISPVCNSIKIINLSIGDESKIFYHSISPLARLLDWLSYEYNVLFVVSAGNHLDLSENFNKPFSVENSFFDESTTSLGAQNKVVQFVYNQRAQRRLLAPAESMNAITVGSLHSDQSSISANPDIKNPYMNGTILPCLYSPFGYGYNKSIKPDLIHSGGRQVLIKDQIYSDRITVGTYNGMGEIGHISAIPGESGEKTRFAFTRGTSNATALISRTLSDCYDILYSIEQQTNTESKFTRFSSVLLKAMIIHGCSWSNNMRNNLKHSLKGMETSVSSNGNEEIRRWAGYGDLNFELIQKCQSQRVTLYAYNTIKPNNSADYHIKIPNWLQSIKKIKITVTLAWFSEIMPKNKKYRKASLEFSLSAPKTDQKYSDEVDAEKIAKKAFTVISDSVPPKIADRGTVQHVIYHNKEELVSTEEELIISVKSNKKMDDSNHPNIYGLFVTIEVPEQVMISQNWISFYDEIRSLLVSAPRTNIHV